MKSVTRFSMFLGGALATHPPVQERVERVLPGAAAPAKG